ncbi:MAG: hypothetical protein KAJ39_07345 [Gammaproteobacteria bacterium]|nr:hypothetical protein [Gammaproteobacteria bacterium]
MKYVVAAVSFHENELKIEMVEAENWKEALSKHSLFTEAGDPGDVSWLSDDIEGAKCDAFSGDILFDVLELKNIEKQKEP